MSSEVPTADRDSPIDIRADLVPLLRLLTHIEGFTLAFLESNVPVEGREVAQWLMGELEKRDRPSRLVQLLEPEEDLFGQLQALVPPLAEGEALFVVGFEQAIPSRPEESSPALDRLNRIRERFRALPVALVLVLPRYALDRLTQEAPDFWAWRSGVFEALVPKQRLEQMLQELTQVRYSDYRNLPVTRKREYLEAIRSLVRELEAKPGREHEIAELYARISALAFAPEEAKSAGEKALEIYEDLGDLTGVADALQQLGILAHQRGDLETAESHFRRSLAIGESLANPAFVATSVINLGVIAETRGALDEAHDRYERALPLLEALGDHWGLGSLYHNLGTVAQERKSWDKADRWFRRALEIEEQMGDQSGRARTLHQLGRLAQERGSHDEALDYYNESLEIAEELGSQSLQGQTLFQIGKLAATSGAFVNAASSYRRALQIFESLGMDYEVAATLSELGRIGTESGEVEQSVPLSLRSLRMRRDSKSPEAVIDLHWLQRQREIVGEGRFRQLVIALEGEKEADRILARLDRFGADREETAPPPVSAS